MAFWSGFFGMGFLMGILLSLTAYLDRNFVKALVYAVISLVSLASFGWLHLS